MMGSMKIMPSLGRTGRVIAKRQAFMSSWMMPLCSFVFLTSSFAAESLVEVLEMSGDGLGHFLASRNSAIAQPAIAQFGDEAFACQLAWLAEKKTRAKKILEQAEEYLNQ